MAARIRDGVAGASITGDNLYDERLAIASRTASHTDSACISGGSPTAFERKTVSTLLGAFFKIRALKTGGTSRLPGIL
jgi:hypothetical protein